MSGTESSRQLLKLQRRWRAAKSTLPWGSCQTASAAFDGVPVTVLAGVHPGCFELFVHDPVRTITDLKGGRIGVPDIPGGAPHLYVSVMAAHVGLDPEHDIEWVRWMTLPARRSCSCAMTDPTAEPELGAVLLSADEAARMRELLLSVLDLCGGSMEEEDEPGLDPTGGRLKRRCAP
jgi:hypothetical protein